MRAVHLVLGASAVFMVSGAIGTGCAVKPIVTLDTGDAGALPSTGASSPPGNTVDAATDAQSNVATATVTLSTAPIDFGLVSCGESTASKVYSVTNSSASTALSVKYSATIPSGSLFRVTSGSSGLVFPGASGSITIAMSPIPTTSIAGTALTSTLTVTTDVPGAASVVVPLQVTPQGGSLTLSPAVVDFGQVQLATAGAPIPFTLTNTGNAPVTITFAAPTEPDGGADPELALVYAGSPASTTIAAGGSLADAGATFLPTSPGAKLVTADIQTTDPLCASQASALTMSGTGTTALVTVGPTTLPFGAVSCGQAASPLQVTLRNASPGSVNFTSALGKGTSSPFTIDVTSGTIPGDTGDAGTAVITVTPKAIPSSASLTPGAFDDTLLVTPKTPFVSPTTVLLDESAQGAVLGALMSNTRFGTVENEAASLSFTVTNSGNIDAPLQVVATGTGYAAAVTSVPPTANAGNGVAIGRVTLTPTINGSEPGSLTVTTTAPLCAPPPALILLTATGAVPVASIPSDASIAVSAICDGGTGGSANQGSVTITNEGNAPLTIASAASVLGTFTISSAPTAPIGTSETGTITIQALANEPATDGGAPLDDTLTFTTNEPGAPTYSVPVTVAVSCP